MGIIGLMLLLTACSKGSAETDPKKKAPLEVMPPPGRALYFDGAQAHVETNIIPDGTLFKNFTIECWVKSPAEPGWSILTQDGFSGPVCSDIFAIRWESSPNNVAGTEGVASIKIDGAYHISSFKKLAKDTWYHLAATYDGYSLKAYKNGCLISENNTINPTPESGPINPDDGTTQMLLGRHPDGELYFNGTVDEVRIWTVARSESEILNHMCKVVESSESGLYACFRFDQSPVENKITDLSENHEAVLVNLAETSQIMSDAPMNIPVFSVAELPSLTDTSVTIQNMFPDGTSYSDVTAKGVCWNTSANPTLEGNHTDDGTAIEDFSSALTGLEPETAYYLRGYVVNGQETVYGNEIIIQTHMTPSGYALKVQKSQDSVKSRVKSGPGTQIETQFTIECWVKADNDPTTAVDPDLIRVEGNPYGTGPISYSGMGFHWDYQVAYVLTFETEPTISMVQLNPGDDHLWAGTWYHLAAVYDGTTLIAYKNGVETGQVAVSGILISGTDTLNMQFFYEPEIDGGGIIDNVRIWNIARTSLEIQNNMYNTFMGTEEGLVACYRFDNISDVKAGDDTIHHNYGVVNGDPEWVVSDRPVE